MIWFKFIGCYNCIYWVKTPTYPGLYLCLKLKKELWFYENDPCNEYRYFGVGWKDQAKYHMGLKRMGETKNAQR